MQNDIFKAKTVDDVVGGEDSELQLLQRAFFATQSGVMITDAGAHDDPIVFVNHAFERITGYGPGEALGHNPRFLQAGENDQPALGDLREAREIGNDDVEWTGVLRNYRKDGTPFWSELNAAAVCDGAGRVTHHVGIINDVTEREEAGENLRRAEALFRSTFDDVAVGMALTDPESEYYLRVNQACCEMFGYPEEELLAMTFRDLTHPEDRETTAEHIRRVWEEGVNSYQHEKRYVCADGRVVWALTSVSVVRDVENRPLYFVAQMQDVTERKRAEKELEESEQRLQTIASNLPVITFALDSAGVFTFENGAALKTLGLEPGWSLGRSVFEIYAAFPEVLENVRRALSGEEVVSTVEIGDMYFHAIYTPQKDGNGEVEGVIGVATNITERRRLEQELEYRSNHDPLTGLANRRLLFDRLSSTLQRANRNGEPVSMLYLDLDGFKEVNDRYGHETGDALLQAVAGRIEHCLRPPDTAARMGGDEFIVLLERTDAETARAIARRIEMAIRPPFSIGERDIRIRVSSGLACTGADPKDAAQLLREADREMYRAKRKPASED